MKKRKDECMFCKSRSCYERVMSSENSGLSYDEIACMKHIKGLHEDFDVKAPKIKKWFISSSGKLSRGIAFQLEV